MYMTMDIENYYIHYLYGSLVWLGILFQYHLLKQLSVTAQPFQI